LGIFKREKPKKLQWSLCRASLMSYCDIYDVRDGYCDIYDACDEYYDIYDACDEYYDI
jgi:hypothetical protein